MKPYLKKAGKLSVTNEEEAYLLGIILRRAVASGELPEYEEEEVHQIAKQYVFTEYYESKLKPYFDDWSVLTILFSIIGLIGVVTGLKAMLLNSYVMTFHTTYLVEVIKSGGYLFILGLIFFVGGFLKGKLEYQRKVFLARE